MVAPKENLRRFGRVARARIRHEHFINGQPLQRLARRHNCSHHTITRIIRNEYSPPDNIASDDDYLNTISASNQSQFAKNASSSLSSRSVATAEFSQEYEDSSDGDHCFDLDYNPRARRPVGRPRIRTKNRGRPRLTPTNKDMLYHVPVVEQETPSVPATCGTYDEPTDLAPRTERDEEFDLKCFLDSLDLSHLVEIFHSHGYITEDDLLRLKGCSRSDQEILLNKVQEGGNFNSKEWGLIYVALTP